MAASFLLGQVFVPFGYVNAQEIALEATSFSYSSAVEDGSNNKVDSTQEVNTVGNALVPAIINPGTIDGVDDGEALSDQISVYVIRKGDSIGQIAEMFDVSPNTILWANDLKKGAPLVEGDTLVILPVDGISYTVAKGDTLKKIAEKLDSDALDIAGYNGMSIDDQLTAGQELIVPYVEMSTPTTSKPKTTISKTHKTYANSTQKNVSGYFAYPVKLGGAVRKTQGLHARGRAVDFGAPVGTPVYAAADGTVILAKGNDAYNGGFGNYIIISHPNGTQTLYAHLSQVMVSLGNKVSQGQVIGLSGGKPGAPGAGKTTGPHLHFEVYNAKNPF